MQNIKNAVDLKNAIAQLTAQQSMDLFLLKEELRLTKEKFKISNIIKSGFKEVTSTPNITTDIFKAAAGLATGFVTKKILIGKTINPIKNLLGMVLEVFVANKVVNNADTLKSVGNVLLKKIMPKRGEREAV